MADAPLQIALVSMPWASPRRPSIALGILTRICEEVGAACRSYFGNVDLVPHVGLEIADAMANENSLYGASEHLFACNLFTPQKLDSDAYLDVFTKILRDEPIGAGIPEALSDVSFLRRVRDEVIPSFLEEMARRILEESPVIVGFTATFNQALASLALAARLKREQPELIVVVGGACFDGEMGREYQRAFPDLLDHVFLGEAEESFREFLRCVREGRAIEIGGVTTRTTVDTVSSVHVADMNRVPAPTYRPYFHAKQRVEQALKTRIEIDFLLYESSRGCWWGETQHCVFCGINPDVMHFRSKSPERVVGEVTEMAREHGVTRFLATDWILSREHREELFSRFERSGIDLDLFYEVRADLAKADVARMKRAGVNAVQPGIESFSTPLLKLMRKWSTGLKQVQFLRWCRELGVVPHYNLLFGFPGDLPEHYQVMLDWLPRLFHLQPPLDSLHPVELHRFAPLFEHPEDFGGVKATPRPDYRANFPAGRVDPTKIGYFYLPDGELGSGASSGVVQQLRETISIWLAAHKRAPTPSCEYAVGDSFVEVTDRRLQIERRFVIKSPGREVILLCDEVHSISRLLRDLSTRWTETEVRASVAELDRLGLILIEDDHVLALPTSRRVRSTEELRERALGAELKKPRLTVLGEAG